MTKKREKIDVAGWMRKPKPQPKTEHPTVMESPHSYLIESIREGERLEAEINPNASIQVQPGSYQIGLNASMLAKETSKNASKLASPLNLHASSKIQPHRIQLNIRLKESLIAQIKNISLKRKISIQAAIEEAASMWVEKMEASMLAHDDMMIFTTHEDIIMRYRHFTLQVWNPRDDQIGQRYNGTDLQLLDIAFITTIEKKLRGNTAKQPIKSFNYFTTEIDLLLEQQKCGELPVALDEYHKYVLSTWEKRIRKIRDEKWSAT